MGLKLRGEATMDYSLIYILIAVSSFVVGGVFVFLLWGLVEKIYQPSKRAELAEHNRVVVDLRDDLAQKNAQLISIKSELDNIRKESTRLLDDCKKLGQDVGSVNLDLVRVKEQHEVLLKAKLEGEDRNINLMGELNTANQMYNSLVDDVQKAKQERDEFLHNSTILALDLATTKLMLLCYKCVLQSHQIEVEDEIKRLVGEEQMEVFNETAQEEIKKLLRGDAAVSEVDSAQVQPTVENQ